MNIHLPFARPCEPMCIPALISPTCSRQSQAGAGLLEVLVAVIVLALGLLGLAGLQMNALKSSHSAQLRSQASLLAVDLGNRMQAALERLPGGHYDGAYVTTLADAASGANPCHKPIADFTIEKDLDQWKHCVELLPSGQASVTALVKPPTNRFLISIQWDDSRAARSDTDDTGGDQVFHYIIDL